MAQMISITIKTQLYLKDGHGKRTSQIFEERTLEEEASLKSFLRVKILQMNTKN
jgi:hypothetical protein